MPKKEVVAKGITMMVVATPKWTFISLYGLIVSLSYSNKMSEFAFFRFMSNNMLDLEEQQHKDEIVSLTEQVLDAKGIECDSSL